MAKFVQSRFQGNLLYGSFAGWKGWQLPLRLAKFVLVAYLGSLMVLMLLETTMMYPRPPRDDGDWQPSWLKFEDVQFDSEDGTHLHGWFCEHPAPQLTILMLHGNGEHVAYLADELDFLRNRFEANVLAFDYRGYGQSEGTPHEAGILADGEAAQRWLSQRTGQSPDSIVLFGRSLGGAVAVHVAAKLGARALVLDRTFSSMVDVASNLFAWAPVGWFLRNRYPSIDRIAGYRGPLFQVHGKPDEIVPFRFGKALFDAAPSAPKKLVISESLTHNDPWPEEVYEELESFIQQLPR